MLGLKDSPRRVLQEIFNRTEAQMRAQRSQETLTKPGPSNYFVFTEGTTKKTIK